MYQNFSKLTDKYRHMEKRQKIFFWGISGGVGFIAIISISTWLALSGQAQPTKSQIVYRQQQEVKQAEQQSRPFIEALDTLKDQMNRHSDQTSKALTFQFDQIREEIQKGIDNSKNDDALKAYHEMEKTITQQMTMLTHSLNASSEQYVQELSQISNQLVAIQKAQAKEKKQLNPEVLPFEVLSVDWWNGVQKINVQDKHNLEYGLLTVGQNYDGWIPVEINHSHQGSTQITFIETSDQNNIVMVML